LGTILHFAESFQERRLSQELCLGHNCIKILEIAVVSPFGLTIRGAIGVGRSFDSPSIEEPFAAEIRTSDKAPTLDSFVFRFGDWDHLVANQLIPAGMPTSLCCHTCPYRIAVGTGIAGQTAEPVRWAFEFSKVNGGVEPAGTATGKVGDGER
jgi:hypothetical protein